jgi:hypothetical protein
MATNNGGELGRSIAYHGAFAILAGRRPLRTIAELIVACSCTHVPHDWPRPTDVFRLKAGTLSFGLNYTRSRCRERRPSWRHNRNLVLRDGAKAAPTTTGGPLPRRTSL